MWKPTAILAVITAYAYAQNGSDALLSAFLLLVYLSAFSFLVES